ncbi:phosphoribosylformylglycinamidine cyclo-ligase [Chloroflexota bacterium]
MAQEMSKYAAAGVNIDAGNEAVSRIKKHARSTFNSHVLTDLGFFGGLYQLPDDSDKVLVSSVDGVGTKLKLAITLNKHDTVGMDIVNHCINDIFTCGASPLFFMDYLAVASLDPAQAESIVSGLASACRDAGIVLLGGETAEMPGMYAEGDYDLAGFVLGIVEKDKVINGSGIAAGDVMFGLPSSGLHTNGYSLVRRIFGDDAVSLNKVYPELGQTLGEVLLEPHRCYFKAVKPVLPYIKGMAHITGGGLIENAPRIIPDGLTASFNAASWEVPPIYELIEKTGDVSRDEMHRVFNMGIGMVLVCSPGDVNKVKSAISDAIIVGEIVDSKDTAKKVVIV